MRIQTLHNMFCMPCAVSYTCYSLCETMTDENTEVLMYVPTSDPSITFPFIRRAVPVPFRRLFRYERLSPLLTRRLEQQYLNALQKGDVAYLWPGVSLDMIRRVKEKNVPVVMERISCHQGTAKRIMDEAYRRQGWPTAHSLTAQSVEEEKEELRHADAVFAPSPLVADSLLENGVPEGKILQSFYGWEPARFQSTDTAFPNLDGLTCVFVGRLSLAKGVPMLLRAWEKSGINGTLLLVGKTQPDVQEHCAEMLSTDRVRSVGFQDNVGALFRSAQVFVFPTFTEGSPMAVYEAMGCGLPVITTPMGAGEVCRHGIDGFVLDPYDEAGWIHHLQLLDNDVDLRTRMGAAARERSLQFTWQAAGIHRRNLLQERFG